MATKGDSGGQQQLPLMPVPEILKQATETINKPRHQGQLKRLRFLMEALQASLLNIGD